MDVLGSKGRPTALLTSRGAAHPSSSVIDNDVDRPVSDSRHDGCRKSVEDGPI